VGARSYQCAVLEFFLMDVYPFDAQELVEICKANGATLVGLFGSMARGDATESSDIDLLVRLAQPKSLLSMVALERQLSDAAGRKVDLLTEGALSPYLRDRILDEVQVLYASG
jgi:predicted nucleotidyltransferase